MVYDMIRIYIYMYKWVWFYPLHNKPNQVFDPCEKRPPSNLPTITTSFIVLKHVRAHEPRVHNSNDAPQEGLTEWLTTMIP